jgi:hypothetical protein
MRLIAFATGSALILLAQPALGREDDEPEPAKPTQPLANRDVGAMDVAKTPITDLNIHKNEIPQLLLDAQASPYNTAGLGRCSQIAAAVGEFDAVLGQDVDLPANATPRVSPGRVAQSVVGSFIPFRGIVRELSGANAQDRALQYAIQSGLARRAFLKGYGEAKGCRYPARSATRAEWNEQLAAARKPPEPESPASNAGDSSAQVADSRQK